MKGRQSRRDAPRLIVAFRSGALQGAVVRRNTMMKTKALLLGTAIATAVSACATTTSPDRAHPVRGRGLAGAVEPARRTGLPAGEVEDAAEPRWSAERVCRLRRRCHRPPAAPAMAAIALGGGPVRGPGNHRLGVARWQGRRQRRHLQGGQEPGPAGRGDRARDRPRGLAPPRRSGSPARRSRPGCCRSAARSPARVTAKVSAAR